jgi:hypothetical protein
MMSERDTLPKGGTEDATPIAENDTANDWDYYDPDEDQDTASAQEDVTENGAEEADGQEPDDEASDDDADEDAEGESQDAATTATVKLPDGTELPQDEVVKGYLRQADYSRKTEEVKTMRVAVSQEAERLKAVTEQFTDFLATMIPDEPDISLAYQDPARYTAMKANYDATVSQLQNVLALKQAVDQSAQAVDQGAQVETLKAENEALAAMFPETRNPQQRQAFFEGAYGTAREIGFSDAELQQATDHRLFALAHWAKRGLAAEQARVKAREKVVNVPPVTPQNKRGVTGKTRQVAKNRDAMARLQKSGSIHDALAIDFE